MKTHKPTANGAADEERPVRDQDRQDGEDRGDAQQQDTVEDDLRHAGAGQGQQSTTPVRIIVGAEVIAAHVATEFQIAAVDNIMAAVETLALTLIRHAPDVTGPEEAQQCAAQASPGDFKARRQAVAAGLHAGGCGRS